MEGDNYYDKIFNNSSHTMSPLNSSATSRKINVTDAAERLSISLPSGTILPLVNILIGCVGLAGNIFVVAVIVGFTSMHKQLTNVFVINQSVIDAVSSLLLIMQIASTFPQPPKLFFKGDFFSELTCRLWYSQVLLWGMFTSSTYNLISLTFERYLKIVHPIVHKDWFDGCKVKTLLVFVWLFGVAFQMSYGVPTATIIGTTCSVTTVWPNAVFKQFFGFLILVIQYWLPVLIFIIAYSKIIFTLKRKP